MWLEPRKGESGRRGRQGGGRDWIGHSLTSCGKGIGFYFEGGGGHLAIATFAEVRLGVEITERHGSG